MEKTLEDYYNSDYDEINRLEMNKEHSIEYITTIHFIKKHLVDSCTILDCCAGGGIYAFPLAEDGYKVIAGDIIPKHVEAIREADVDNLLSEICECNALNMPQFADDTFDVVMCLGALYHLSDYDQRKACIKECLRVLKPNGIFIFSYINRNARFIHNFMGGRIGAETSLSLFKSAEDANDPFYSFELGEQNKLVAEFPLSKITDVGIDGLRYPFYDKINNLSDEEFEKYMEYHFATCEHPSIIGHSMHGLWIGKKSEGDLRKRKQNDDS